MAFFGVRSRHHQGMSHPKLNRTLSRRLLAAEVVIFGVPITGLLGLGLSVLLGINGG